MVAAFVAVVATVLVLEEARLPLLCDVAAASLLCSCYTAQLASGSSPPALMLAVSSPVVP